MLQQILEVAADIAARFQEVLVLVDYQFPAHVVGVGDVGDFAVLGIGGAQARDVQPGGYENGVDKGEDAHCVVGDVVGTVVKKSMGLHGGH